jgi:hypothetical protein
MIWLAREHTHTSANAVAGGMLAASRMEEKALQREKCAASAGAGAEEGIGRLGGLEREEECMAAEHTRRRETCGFERAMRAAAAAAAEEPAADDPLRDRQRHRP